MIAIDGQLSIFDLLTDVEAKAPATTLRNGLMLDVTDPEEVNRHHEAWSKFYGWPKYQHFYGFRYYGYSSVTKTDGHEYASFSTDLRCHHTLPGGFGGEGNPPNLCSCVGERYERAYCFTCKWWSPIARREIEADALGYAHALGIVVDKPVKLPFTVFTGPRKYDGEECAYCGTKKNLNEGGCGPAGGGPGFSYNICNPCSVRYRTMRPPSELWTYKEIA